MLQAGCSIKEVKLWKQSMILSIIEVLGNVIVLIVTNFTINSLQNQVDCTA
jgi:hypothetical protein